MKSLNRIIHDVTICLSLGYPALLILPGYFVIASRTFAYHRLTAFSGFMRECLDRVIKADQCAQYVDDIGIAANDANHLIANLRATFECIREAGLKLTMHKCHFGANEIDFLGRTITNFLEKTKFPKFGKAAGLELGCHLGG